MMQVATNDAVHYSKVNLEEEPAIPPLPVSCLGVSQGCGARSLGLDKFGLQHVSKQAMRKRMAPSACTH
jgi:hypothetical protein